MSDVNDKLQGESNSITTQKKLLEDYARNTSKKIRSTFTAKGNSGKHVASTTPYGYLKSEADHDLHRDGALLRDEQGNNVGQDMPHD